MPSLLAIESSPRGEHSVSRKLTQTFIDAWKSAHSGGTVVVRDLMKTDLPFVDLPWIAGAYSPEEMRSPEMQEALRISDELIAELKAADHLVIGTSMYNFSTPANLKAWIDHIVRINETFGPGYVPLLQDKKTTIIIASSGVYAPGSPAAGYDKESDYLKFVLGFIGIKSVDVVLAGGTSAVDQGKTSMPDLLAQFDKGVQQAAQA